MKFRKNAVLSLLLSSLLLLLLLLLSFCRRRRCCCCCCYGRRCCYYGAPVGLWPYNLVGHNSKDHKMNPHRSKTSNLMS
jgi:hypothetical protein